MGRVRLSEGGHRGLDPLGPRPAARPRAVGDLRAHRARRVGGLDSTIIGAAAYFHPTRLYYGAKLGDDVDQAFRLTLETIWSHFVDGGFRHDAAWHAYGPYLTLQLAHAFLLIGDVDRMDACLGWAIGNAGVRPSAATTAPREQWQVTTGAGTSSTPTRSPTTSPRCRSGWYMGDMPHGWAAAEFMPPAPRHPVLRGRRGRRPGALHGPRRLPAGSAATAATRYHRRRATSYGATFGYTLRHDEPNRRIVIDIPNPLPAVRYVYACRFGEVTRVLVGGIEQPPTGRDVRLAPGTTHAEISYS